MVEKFLMGIIKLRYLLIFSLIISLTIALSVNKNYISPDGISYQNIAVNIVNGNGYSRNVDYPFAKQYFREPGYPYLFAGACLISKLLGNECEYVLTEPDMYYYDNLHIEITILRLIQAVIVVFTILLFYRTIMLLIKDKKQSLIISFLFSIYLPYLIFITFPLREIFVSFLLMWMSYLVLIIPNDKADWKNIVIFSLVFGVLVLTLQAYVYVLPFFLLTIVFLSRGWVRAIKISGLIILLFLLFVSGWTYRGYKEAKNLKVIKTFGIAYTYELKHFLDANYIAYKVGLDNPEYFRKKMSDEYWQDGKVIFDRSFSGYYKHYADSLNQVISKLKLNTTVKKSKFYFNDIIRNNFRKSLIWPFWQPDYRRSIFELYNSESRLSISISFGFGLLNFVLFLIGFFYKIKYFWMFLPVFTFHLLMIPFMADEGRRVLPFLPFYVMFTYYGGLHIWKQILKFRLNQSVTHIQNSN